MTLPNLPEMAGGGPPRRTFNYTYSIIETNQSGLSWFFAILAA